MQRQSNRWRAILYHSLQRILPSYLESLGKHPRSNHRALSVSSPRDALFRPGSSGLLPQSAPSRGSANAILNSRLGSKASSNTALPTYQRCCSQSRLADFSRMDDQHIWYCKFRHLYICYISRNLHNQGAAKGLLAQHAALWIPKIVRL